MQGEVGAPGHPGAAGNVGLLVSIQPQGADQSVEGGVKNSALS